jgi:hypothetical protein
MDELAEMIKRLTNWSTEADRIIDELAAIETRRINAVKSEKAEVELRYKKVFLEGENWVKEVKPLIDQFLKVLTPLQENDHHIQNIIALLRSGSNLLENTPKFRTPANFLIGMYNYFSIINRSLSAHFRSPVFSIANLDISQKTREALFFYNGISTIGELQYAIRSGKDLGNMTPAALLECQHELKARGYSIYPLSDNKQYWEELSDQAQGLWMCLVNGKLSIYVEIDMAQAKALSKYPCVARLPNGSLVAKLEV